MWSWIILLRKAWLNSALKHIQIFPKQALNILYQYVHCGSGRLYKFDLLGAYLWSAVEKLRKGLERVEPRLFSVKTVWTTLPHWVFVLLLNKVTVNYTQPQVVLTNWSITKKLIESLIVKNNQSFSNHIHFCNHIQWLVWAHCYSGFCNEWPRKLTE